jgi:hypothetical protein
MQPEQDLLRVGGGVVGSQVEEGLFKGAKSYFFPALPAAIKIEWECRASKPVGSLQVQRRVGLSSFRISDV